MAQRQQLLQMQLGGATSSEHPAASETEDTAGPPSNLLENERYLYSITLQDNCCLWDELISVTIRSQHSVLRRITTLPVLHRPEQIIGSLIILQTIWAHFHKTV